MAIVNEEFARRFGLGRDMIGRQIFDPSQPQTIIGMVGNVRTRGLQTTPSPEVYMCALRFTWTNQYLVVRSSIPADQLVKQTTAAIRSSNSEQVVYGATTMEQLIADSVTLPRFQVFLIGLFALFAMAMASAGIYSVISCLVAQRTSEIAVRIALGADGRSIVRTVLGATMTWIAAGLSAGLALGLATRNIDPISFERCGRGLSVDVRFSSGVLLRRDLIRRLATRTTGHPARSEHGARCE